MILIIGAMKEEVSFLISKLENKQEISRHGFSFYTGQFQSKDLVVVESGIGKVMSGILVATAVSTFENIEYVINIGVAGGLSSCEIGDVVIGANTFYGDADVTIFSSYQYGQMPRFPFLFAASPSLKELAVGLGAKEVDICTMDRFVHDQNWVNELIRTHFSYQNIQCFDMESAAFAQSCHFFKLQFISIRAISDIIGTSSQDTSYEESLEFACNNSNQFLLKVVEKL